MKLLLTLILSLFLSQSLIADDRVHVALQFFSSTALKAEIGAVRMAAAIDKDAEQIVLTSKEVKDPMGQSFWIAEIVIKLPVSQLESAKQKVIEHGKQYQKKEAF
jgi:hypothetical protein